MVSLVFENPQYIYIAIDVTYMYCSLEVAYTHKKKKKTNTHTHGTQRAVTIQWCSQVKRQVAYQ